MRYNILIFLSLFFLLGVKAQTVSEDREGSTGFHMRVDIPSRKGSELLFGKYQNGNSYVIDTIVINSKGRAVFESKEKLLAGQFFLYIKSGFQIDLLLDKEQEDIHLTINDRDFSRNKVKGCRDTQLLWEYKSYEGNIVSEENKYQKQLEKDGLSDSSKDALRKKISSLDDKLKKFTESFIQENKDTWAGIFIKGSQSIEYPYPEITNEKEYIANKIYAKEHFFDNVNLNDARFWRTDFFPGMIDIYMQHWAGDTPQELAESASSLVAKTKDDAYCFKEMLSRLVNQFVKTRKANDENIWTRLYEDYIEGKDIPWITSEQGLNMKINYRRTKDNRVGSRASDLSLSTLDGQEINTKDIDADLLLLYFYDPDCGHCQTSTPEIYTQLYEKYKNRGLKVIAINTSDDKQKWADFVAKNNLVDWLNGMDNEPNSGLWLKYNLMGTPENYLVDKEKIIIDKRLDLQELDAKVGSYLNSK